MKSTTAFILILISIALAYTFTMPEYQKVEALRAEAAGYKDVLGSVSDLSEKRDELLLKYNAMPKAELDNLQKILPDDVNVVELALNLDAIAGKYGLSIKSVKTIDEQTDPSATVVQNSTGSLYQKVKIGFSFVGSYQSFRSFTSDLERNLRILEIEKVSISTSDSGLNEYQMEVEAYWLK